jgi:hypothetical protein
VKKIYILFFLLRLALTINANPITVKVNIAYSQKTVKENIYILESTQTWGRALKRADYSLTFDTSVQIDSLSLKADSFTNNVYFWNKQDFYPNENFKVWIK